MADWTIDSWFDGREEIEWVEQENAGPRNDDGEHRCHCYKIPKKPGVVHNIKPIGMRFVVGTANGHAGEVCAIIAEVEQPETNEMQIDDVWLFTQQELANFWTKFQNPKNKGEYLAFVNKQRIRLPRIRPEFLSRHYDESRESSIRLFW